MSSLCEGISMVVGKMDVSSVGETPRTIEDGVVSLVIEFSLSMWIPELFPLYDNVLPEEST